MVVLDSGTIVTALSYVMYATSWWPCALLILIVSTYVSYLMFQGSLTLRMTFAGHVWQWKHPLSKPPQTVQVVTYPQSSDSYSRLRQRYMKKNTNRDSSSTTTTVPYGYRIRCLVVGCNYSQSDKLSLNGSIPDCERVRDFWQQRMKLDVYNRGAFATCTDHSATPWTSSVQFQAIDWLVYDLKPGDRRFFHISGHGIPLQSLDGTVRVEHCILPLDSEVPGTPTLSDVDLFQRLVAPHKNTGAYTFVFCDLCYSGQQLLLRYSYECNPVTGKVEAFEDISHPEWHDDQAQMNVVCLAASRFNEKAKEQQSWRPDYSRPLGRADTWEVESYGAMTDAFYDELDKPENFDAQLNMPTITWRTMLQRISRRMLKNYQMSTEENKGPRPQNCILSSTRPLVLDAPLLNFEFTEDVH